MIIWNSFWKLSSTTSTSGISAGSSRSLNFSWVCKRASQSTTTFSVYGTVGLCPNTTSRKTGDLRALVGMKKVFLSLLIKVGLVKDFVKVMDINDAAFQCLCTLFPALSSTKLKEGIFVGPQI
ncbi:hypothetical protein FHG87_017567 [Trinorchestia longiramus]|nr:hypothetical protein FHG87_017567 [Trinorchestia longiramus]